MLLSIFLIGMLCSNTTAPIQFPEQLLEQVTVIVSASEAEEFSQVVTKPLKSLPYDTLGQIFGAFEKPEVVPAVGKFSNMLRFTVKEVQKIHSMFERRDTRSLCRSSTYTTLFFISCIFGDSPRLVDTTTGEAEEDGVEDEYHFPLFFSCSPLGV